MGCIRSHYSDFVGSYVATRYFAIRFIFRIESFHHVIKITNPPYCYTSNNGIMHLSIASPIPPTWGICRELVGDLFEFRCPTGRAWWDIVLEVTAFIYLTI